MKLFGKAMFWNEVIQFKLHLRSKEICLHSGLSNRITWWKKWLSFLEPSDNDRYGIHIKSITWYAIL